MLLLILLLVFFSLPTTDPAKSVKFRCPETISVAWVEVPPYIYRDWDNTTKGLLAEIFERGLNSKLGGCCTKNVSVVYDDPFRDYEELLDTSFNMTYDAVMPIVLDLGKERYLAFPFVLLVESPGAVLLNYRRQATSTNIINTFVSILPLVVLLLLYVCVFGVVFWMVDTIPKKNGENRSIIVMLGEVCEGIWWAFVTLATVGYGDVVPTKFASRVVTYIWMLLSSIFVAFFTASVTTALTSECFSVDLKIPGEKIAAINGSREHQLILKKSGIPEVFQNYKEYFEKAIAQEHIKGTVVELYAASFYSEKFKTLRIQEIFDDVTAYGVVLQAKLKKIQGCLKQFVLSSQKEIYEKIRKKLPPLKPDIEATVAEENSLGILTLTISKLQNTLIILTVLLVFLSVIGILRERFLLKPKSVRRSKSTLRRDVGAYQNMLSSTFEDMLADIDNVKNNLNDVIQQINDRTMNDTVTFEKNYPVTEIKP